MPGKIHSKKQFRFLQAAAHGYAKEKGMSEETAKEMLDSEPSGLYKRLPESAKKKKRRKSHA